MSRGLLTADGQVIIVDNEDYMALSQYVWHIDAHGLLYRLQYFGKKKVKTYIYQDLLTVRKGMVVTHTDGNSLNCTRQNLKALERSEARKETSLKTNPCRGVVRLRNGMFRAQLHWANTQIVIGFFKSEADASAAYSIWAWQNRRYFIPNHAADDPELVRVKAMLNEEGFYKEQKYQDTQFHIARQRYRGVKFDRHAKTHIAIIGFGRRKIRIGKRKLAAEAARLYDAAAIVRFGNKAKLNFPNVIPDPEYLDKARRVLSAASTN